MKLADLLYLLRFVQKQFWQSRTWLILAGVLSCGYAIAVMIHVQFIPDLGMKSAFSRELRGLRRDVVVEPGQVLTPQPGDLVIRVADLPIASWPDLLRAPQIMQQQVAEHGEALEKLGLIKREAGQTFVQVEFERVIAGQVHKFLAWCVLGRLPIEELIPAILWFFLKILLFIVGVLVFWNRSQDSASVQFFVLCIFTLGAYMGGYHWPHISTAPLLLTGFIVWSVLLPPVTLHFYLVFPRCKGLLVQRPRLTLAVVYGPPLVFLSLLLYLYLHSRWLYRVEAAPADIAEALETLKNATYCSLYVAALWYLLSVAALLHSYWYAIDATERNQVKCIFWGALLAMVPIGYSLHMARFRPEDFGAGHATWPMFAASVCLTSAFIISITQYRLMELDQLISSSVLYFLISFLIGLVYYAVVILGTLIFNQVLASPPLSEALRASTVALLLMVVMDLARSRFKSALDRRFNREKYHLDRTLQRMSEAVQQLIDPPTLVQRLLHASSDLLGIARGAVYLYQDEPACFRLAGWVGPAPAQVELPAHGPLIEALRQGENVVTVGRQEGGPSPAQQQLQALGGEVAQALAQTECLRAFLILGPKTNSSYRPEDLNLLSAFAQITVLALGNAAGHNTIEALNRDVQTKIDKIAEQQRRIFALQSQLRRQSLTRAMLADEEDAAVRPESSASRAERSAEPPAPESGTTAAFGNIVGSSPQVRQLLQMVRKVARTEAVVLIRGESGTGKELLAQAVHEASERANAAFVKVHCAALSPTLLESELFGHVKGAFTGAHRDKVGRFELANGGTLFLDEIGDVSLDVQTKLLRVLQERTFERVGSSETIKVDVRIIAATHQKLEELIRQGRFREDLYYRLNVFPIPVPPLRQRPEDIQELALHFLHQSARRCGKDVVHIEEDAMQVLRDCSWPGNIRQLENVIERAVVLVEGRTISVRDLSPEITCDGNGNDGSGADGWFAAGKTPAVHPGRKPLRVYRLENEDLEREQILQALAEADGNKALAARNLGVARSTLVSRLKKYGIN